MRIDKLCNFYMNSNEEFIFVSMLINMINLKVVEELMTFNFNKSYLDRTCNRVIINPIGTHFVIYMILWSSKMDMELYTHLIFVSLLINT